VEETVEKLSKEEEYELIKRIENGDEAAKDELFKHFSQTVYGFFSARVYSPKDIKGLVDETFKVVENELKKRKFNPKYRFYTFLRNFAMLPVWRIYLKTMKLSGGEEIYENTAYTEPDQDRHIVWLEMLRLLFLCGGKPHQIIAFCYCKLLEWKPVEMVNELSPFCLEKLSGQFNNTYYERVCISVDYDYFITNYCMLFIEKLDKSVTIVYTESEYQSIQIEFESAMVKELLLRSFYTEMKPTLAISNWTYRVEARLKKAVRDGGCPDLNPEP
jgi:hypothetical protein